MGVINHMSKTFSDSAHNKPELDQPEPSKRYAQAQEDAENKEWNVTNPYKYEQPAEKAEKKVEDCPPKPKKPTLAEFADMKEEEQTAYLQSLGKWLGCEVEKSQSLKECQDKCGPQPEYDRPTDGFVEAKKEAHKKLTKAWLKYRQICEKKFEFKRGNPFERPELPKKKEMKLCDCPPATRNIAVDILVRMKPEKRKEAIKNIIRNIGSQAVCVEKCKQEGKQIRPDQLPKTEAATESKKEKTIERPKF